MHTLKATEVPKHYRLLTAFTERSAALAASFIATVAFSLEPRLETQWLAGMAAVAQITGHAGGLTPLSDHQAHRRGPWLPTPANP